jgi:uncharacterized membrane protein YheB (UPF0754 family)
MNYLLFLIPLAGALVGWCSNRCLTWIVFHPKYPFRIFGVTLHGIIPKNKDLIAKKLAQYSKTIFKPEELLAQLGDASNLEKIRPMIDEHLDHFLRVKLAKEMPFITAFIGDKTINSLKALFMTELEQLFPQIMGAYAGTLHGEFNIEQLVMSKMSQVSIEDELRKSLSKELRFVELIGASIGLLIGVLIMVVVLIK